MTWNSFKQTNFYLLMKKMRLVSLAWFFIKLFKRTFAKIKNLKNTFLPIKVVNILLMRKRFKSKVAKYKSEGLALKIVVGSEGIYDKGWIPSEKCTLDLVNECTWKKYFQENEIESILAEHVYEHLTVKQTEISAAICYKYLKHGGYMRLAVPDGFHNNQDYIDYVKPYGYGAGADDHKVLFNYKSFSTIFEKNGFQIKLLEYFDEKKVFHFNEWNVSEGKIHRSFRYDERNKDGKKIIRV